MFSRGIVENPGKLADQLFKHQPHLAVADFVRVQINAGKALGHPIQQPGFGETHDLGLEVEVFGNAPHRCRKVLNIGERFFLMWSWSPISFFMSSGEML